MVEKSDDHSSLIYSNIQCNKLKENESVYFVLKKPTKSILQMTTKRLNSRSNYFRSEVQTNIQMLAMHDGKNQGS